MDGATQQIELEDRIFFAGRKVSYKILFYKNCVEINLHFFIRYFIITDFRTRKLLGTDANSTLIDF